MKPYCEPANLGGSSRQADADRPERPDRCRIVSTVEAIIETGGQPA